MTRRVLGPLALLLAAAPAFAQDADEIVPAKWLVLEAPDVRARRPISPNAVFARYLLDRDAAAPAAGEEVTGERGVAVKWAAVETIDGVFDAGNNAAAFTTVTSDAERVVLAVAPGASTVWVNGEPFVGDPYAYGFKGVPVLLRKGDSRVFLTGLRGSVRLVLRPVAEGAHAADWDMTKPDGATRDDYSSVDVGLLVIHASRSTTTVTVGSSGTPVNDKVHVRLLPLGVVKVPRRVQSATGLGVGADSYVQFDFPVRPPGAPHRVTRISDIDGSVQEYAVVEPAPSLAAVPTRIVMSLHGAGADDYGQASSYSRRPGFWIVCPTNRRPYGFDWQDWGRTDAYETLEHFGVAQSLAVSRVFLTGHSMGGHGTWHLAANDPDRFLAIAPSAGWASFDTYGGPRPRSMLWPLWSGADRASDTLALASNLTRIPTLVVHGTADESVPHAQAETMLAALAAAGGSPQHHFEKDGVHWWDGDAAPGADCVDWPGIFELFEKTAPRRGPATVIDWTTVDPAVDTRHEWLRVLRPLRYGDPVRIRATWDDDRRVATVSTSNAARVNVAPSPLPDPWRLEIDGQTIDVDGTTAWLERAPDGWVPAGPRDGWKSPDRCGPLKRAFSRRFALVLPTLGTEDESRETTARVRFDAAQWWYRANGFADVVLDTEVVADAGRFAGRNLVLYGNADTNKAWGTVVGESPVTVERGALRVGDRRFETAAAACFFVRPRADDDAGVVAVLADTGPRGCRLAMQHAIFQSGAGYPDYLAWDERALTLGDGGVLAAGWFDAAWALDGRGFLAFGGEKVAATPPATPPRDEDK